MCHCGNTKRGSAFALSLQGIVHLEISQVSRDDRFAALQIVLSLRAVARRQAAGRCPPISVSPVLAPFHWFDRGLEITESY